MLQADDTRTQKRYTYAPGQSKLTFLAFLGWGRQHEALWFRAPLPPLQIVCNRKQQKGFCPGLRGSSIPDWGRKTSVLCTLLLGISLAGKSGDTKMTGNKRWDEWIPVDID